MRDLRVGLPGHNRPMGRMGRTGQGASTLIGARYRLVERLGRGGMSVVWRGYDEILGRHVAVKVLSAELAGDERFRERLKQEALAAARLCHPHITAIFDFGETSAGAGPAVPYVVMELIDGEPVSARLRRRGPMAWREAATMTAEVASALAVAHARGVVHRDITPANVMLTPAGAKVVDFGISALVGQSDAGPDGSLLGTPAYLAPERLAGGAVLPATDVYALGVLLYRCLTARLPWPAENTNEALRAHLYAAPEPLPALPGLPAAVADLCLRCLAKDPDVRPVAGELAHTLADLTGTTVPLVPWSQPSRSTRSPSPAPFVSSAGPSFALATASLALSPLAVSPVAPSPLALSPTASIAGDPSPSGAAAGEPPPPAGAGARTAPPWPGQVIAAAVAYLGLPLGPSLRRWHRAAPPQRDSRSGRVRRLRAALRVGSRLHLGGVEALGGGVFVGGRLARDLVTGRAIFAGRHRVQATAGTLAVLAMAVLIWAGARGPADATSAQAASAVRGGPAGAGPLHPAGCRVVYQVRRDSGRTFEARLVLRNDGRRALRGWRLAFTYPGDQRLTAKPRRVTQEGSHVVVRGDVGGSLAAGHSLTVNMRGAYRVANPLPQAFALNGRTCDATLLGATSDPAGDPHGKPADVEAAGAADPEK
jgi:eukaryotic-like serine/threonine-protein kinase